MPLDREVDVGPGDPAPPPKGARPQFSAHVCCGQTVGWMKIPLGAEVGLGQGEIVVDGDPVPPKRGTCPILAHVYCGQMIAHLYVIPRLLLHFMVLCLLFSVVSVVYANLINLLYI